MDTNPLNPGKVLSTLGEDGRRIWMRPKISKGRYHERRKWVAYALIATFLILPFVEVGGHPAILLDVAARRFHLFGFSFHPTDSALLMFLMLSIFLGVFWLTALVGRAWCGWGCPQTVYMEYVFRPLEVWIEGGLGKMRRLDEQSGLPLRRAIKYALFAIIAFILGNQFLSYFVGWKKLAHWITSPPLDNPEGFMVMAVTTGLVFFDFAWFREQMCTVICPYARLQSALLDRDSLIVGYDAHRGEPRRRLKVKQEGGGTAGDCIDCGACVTTCPTGIDIREGLQLECINCTQCVDACDHVMDKIGRPRGLIRLSSQRRLEDEKPTRLLRTRTLLYPAIITVLLSLMLVVYNTKGNADVTVLRQLNAPFVLVDDQVRNQLRIKVVNRSGSEQTYALTIEGVDAAQLLAPQFPLPVQDGDTVTSPVFVTLPASTFSEGAREVALHITDGEGFDRVVPYLLLGPQGDTP